MIKILILAAVLISCNNFLHEDHCLGFSVGGIYEICSRNYYEGNPFEDRTKGFVVITAMKGKYIQYRWDHQPTGVLFTRDCEEFQELINNCTPKHFNHE